jgi:hypothetical protein
MEDKIEKSNKTKTIEVLFGLFFFGIAISILVFSELYWGSLLVSFVIFVLAIDLIISAWKNKMSLLSRIGPLP